MCNLYRMPVILAPEGWATWIDGDPEAAFALARKCDLELLVERTSERWAGGASKPQEHVLL